MTSLTPQDTLRLARFALDHADEAAFWMDDRGSILYANAAACRALGYASEELLKAALPDVSPELTPELWSQLTQEVTSRGRFAFEFSMRSKDQRVFSVDMSVHHHPLPGKDILCAFFRDMDERKRLQQLKNEFVSTVSHELRTPMTIIRESVSQLLDGLLGEVPPPQREALYVTLSGIDRLARIINDLLDVSKMEAGKATLHLDRLNLAELIREVVETFASRARERGLELRMSLPARDILLYADYDRLTRVFTNLVGNALKFSDKGSVEISVRERPQEIECVVSDSGIGIAKQDLGRVFNKFEQLSLPAVTGEKGSGLGLSICKGIVELHQGRIWAESEPGRGSSFIFTLPRKSGEDLFRQKMSGDLARAAAAGGHVTGVLLQVDVLKNADPRKAATHLEWALAELMETVKTHGARKTDFILMDSHAVWLGLPGMTNKEAARIVGLILAAYAAVLDKNELGDLVRVTHSLSSFPDEVKNEKEFMNKLLQEKQRNAV